MLLLLNICHLFVVSATVGCTANFHHAENSSLILMYINAWKMKNIEAVERTNMFEDKGAQAPGIFFLN